ncbi:regulatory protein RecX [Isoptericola sp. b515]|uniref:regulatory protein RecX n=1 Tax=Isoptericola sp. b515 TaxID=3064652 RepID=UPI002712B063|nr:regulatory protein RecX [Isoptericola sp. b515]MDO8148470.1 regulatory protein RecX [Isoptericola sp. b515]
MSERLEAGQITRDEATELTREAVLRTLTAAPKSRAELARSLARKGYPEDVAEHVLDRLQEVRLVDDAVYAEMIVRTRHTERGQARRAISAELQRRGVDPETATAALEQIDGDDERAAAAELARKHVARTRGLDRDRRVRRAVGALSRKGHNPSVAFAAVKDALAAEGESEDLDDLISLDD